MAQHSRRYDRVAGDYSQYRPRYPDRLVAHLAGIAGEGARDALRDLAAPHRIDDGHVRFGYLFQCITVRRDP